eukprot:scaffold13794_cov19-Tisochrysis_lutea.AAC.2
MGTDDKFVLRKKPAGRILASAHAVEREYAVLDALSKHHSGVPVPRPLLLCNDKSVIGTPFYLMDLERVFRHTESGWNGLVIVQGAVYVDPNMPEAAPDTRRDVYQQMVRCLAALHNAPVRELGLQNFGDPQEESPNAQSISVNVKCHEGAYRESGDKVPGILMAS